MFIPLDDVGHVVVTIHIPRPPKLTVTHEAIYDAISPQLAAIEYVREQLASLRSAVSITEKNYDVAYKQLYAAKHALESAESSEAQALSLITTKVTKIVHDQVDEGLQVKVRFAFREPIIPPTE